MGGVHCLGLCPKKTFFSDAFPELYKKLGRNFATTACPNWFLISISIPSFLYRAEN